MTFLDFIRRYAGVPLDFDGVAGSTCVDLVNTYLHLVRGTAPVRGNAVDIMHQAIAGARWIANGPTNFPRQGDVVVWRANVPALDIGIYGHTAVALAADPSSLITFDQNWPTGAPASLVIHQLYTGVAGWHHFG